MKKQKLCWQNGKLWRLGLLSLSLAMVNPRFTSALPGGEPASGAESSDYIKIQDPQRIAVTHAGPGNAVQALDSGAAQPLSLAAGDFNEDGIQDLVAGYATPGGAGIVVLYPGNLNAFAPQSYDAWLAIAEQRFPSPFLDTAVAFELPNKPDFLAVGNLQDSNHLEVIAAARGDNTVYVLAGDGHGNLSNLQAVALPGPITAMTVDRFGVGSLSSKLIVGVGGPRPGILVYSSSGTELLPVAEVALSAAPTGFAVDDMDDDGLPDLVIVARGQISILHSASSSGTPRLETLNVSNSAVAVTSGFFVHDRAWRRQLAVVDANGALKIVAHGDFDPRNWRPAELRAMHDAMRHHQPNPFRRTTVGPVLNGWKVIEIVSSAVAHSLDRPPILLRTRVFARGTDDILLIDSEAGQMTVATHPILGPGTNSASAAELYTRAYSGGAPVVALPLRVNADARDGLVVLHQSETAPFVMMPVTGTRGSATAQSLEGTR